MSNTSKAKQCSCGIWFKGTGTKCKRCRNLGKTKHPMHKTWTVHYSKKWPEFLDFIREIGEPPTPGHWLTGAIPGTKPAPGNVRWVPGKRLEEVQLNELPDFTPMIFDDELKRLAIQAYCEKQENPASEILHINAIEEEHRQLIQNATDLEVLQDQLETMSQQYSAQLKKEAEALQANKGRSSQVRVGRAIRNKLVPLLSKRLEQLHNGALLNRSGKHHSVIKPMFQAIGNDYDVVAHISITIILDSIGRGAAMSTPLTKCLQQIGERVEHEAFLRYVEENDPQGWGRIDRWVLQKEEKGYLKKIKEAKGLTQLTGDFKWFDTDAHVDFGNWCWEALWSVTGWIEKVYWVTGRGKKKRAQYFVGLSEEGMKYRDMIQAAADERCFEPWPMLTKPLEWKPDEAIRGGYLQQHAGQVSRMIHNDRGSKFSQMAIDALHRCQSVPFRINPFIYEVEKQLLGKSEDIGSFRTYEKDTWEDTHKPKVDPRILEDKYDENRNIKKSFKDAMRTLPYYGEQKVAEKTRKSPIRVLRVAARSRRTDVLSALLLRQPGSDVLRHRHRHP